MSFDTSSDTITVNDVEYDVVEAGVDGDGDTRLIVEHDDEDAFPGLVAYLGYERFDAALFNPRDWSNVSTMAVKYGGYDLGDEDISTIDFSTECPACIDGNGYALNENGSETDDPCPKCEGSGEVMLNPVEFFKRERGASVVLPLIVYEHSGITMRVGKVGDIPFDSDGWDTSFVGFIFDTPDGIKECYGTEQPSPEQIEEALRQEVSTYASYLEGDITCWSVSDDETDFQDGCGGYVADSEGCKHECFAQIEQAILKRLDELTERAHWAARDVETV
jgi:hypothetical protein